MLEFRVVPDDGSAFELVADTRDVLVWEKTAKGRTMKNLMEDIAITDMYRIAYIAAKRQGLYDGNQQEFEQSVVIDLQNGESPDPTQAAASTDQ